MAIQDRNRVVWFGKNAPKELREEIEARNLQVIVTFDPKEAIQYCRGIARAILIPFSSDPVALKKHLSLLKNEVLDGGSMIGVIYDDKPTSQLSQVTFVISDFPKIEGLSASPIRTFSAAGTASIAQSCFEHSSGKSVNENLILQLTSRNPGDAINPDFIPLFRRAFNDFDSIELRPLTGGLSKAGGIWRVIAKDAASRKRVPFVAKVDFIDAQIEEHANFTTNVVEYVPFPNRPPYLSDRCVVGARHALAVSAFVERADRLDDYLDKKGSASLAMASLFDGPLRTWRANARSIGPICLLDEYQRNVIPKDGEWDSKFDQAFKAARAKAATVLSPLDLLRLLKSMPNVETHICTCHGDLHARNIFIRQNGSDVVLIDFAKTNYESPTSRDPTRLDVTLAFGFDDGRKLDESLIRGLYIPDKIFRLAHHSGDDEHVEAIRQVRLHSRGSAASTNEYLYGLIVHLLWWSKLENNQYDLRGLAYELAVGLSKYLQTRLTRTGSGLPGAQVPSAAKTSKPSQLKSRPRARR